MTDKNLLAVIKSGDESHYLFRDFIQSLPDGSQKIFDSFGYIGGLEKHFIKGFKKEDSRHFLIFRLPTFDGLITKYFSSIPKANCNEIQDNLIVKIDYHQQDTDVLSGARAVVNYTGSIDEMIKYYNDFSSVEPITLLINKLNNSEHLRKNIIKKGLFGLGKRKLLPTYVSVGIETPNGEYLLGTTNGRPPCSGTFKK